MKTIITNALFFLLGCSIVCIIYQINLERFYKNIKIENERYLAEKQSYRLKNEQLKSDLENCKRNYEAVAEEYFDNSDEYEVK